MPIEIPELPDIPALEAHLSEPDIGLVDDLSRVTGDILVLGAGGKMGPTLAMMARKALDHVGSGANVIAAARFSDPEVRERLEASGIAYRLVSYDGGHDIHAETLAQLATR